MEKIKQYAPVLAGLTISIVFGFSFLFTKEGLEVLRPFHLLGLRFALATAVLTLLKGLGILTLALKGKDIKKLLFLALFQPVIYFISETLGVQMTSASEAGMMIALIPIVVTILGALFLNERPNILQLFFIILSVIGVLFIVTMTGSTSVEGNLLGMFVLLGAVFSAAVYNILSRSLSCQFKPVEITYIMMWVGAITFNGLAIVEHMLEGNLVNYFTPLRNIKALTSIVYLGILSSIVAFFMMNYMLSKMEASKSAVFANLVTVVSIIGGVFFRGESFYWYHGLGGCMIILGVWGANYFEKDMVREELSVEQQ